MWAFWDRCRECEKEIKDFVYDHQGGTTDEVHLKDGTVYYYNGFVIECQNCWNGIWLWKKVYTPESLKMMDPTNPKYASLLNDNRFWIGNHSGPWGQWESDGQLVARRFDCNGEREREIVE